jgi:hypothetical protein
VIFVKGTLGGLLAVVSLVLTALCFLMYTGRVSAASADNKLWLILMIIFLIATLVLGGMFLSGRINRNDDVHITE